MAAAIAKDWRRDVNELKLRAESIGVGPVRSDGTEKGAADFDRESVLQLLDYTVLVECCSTVVLDAYRMQMDARLLRYFNRN